MAARQVEARIQFLVATFPLQGIGPWLAHPARWNLTCRSAARDFSNGSNLAVHSAWKYPVCCCRDYSSCNLSWECDVRSCNPTTIRAMMRREPLPTMNPSLSVPRRDAVQLVDKTRLGVFGSASERDVPGIYHQRGTSALLFLTPSYDLHPEARAGGYHLRSGLGNTSHIVSTCQCIRVTLGLRHHRFTLRVHRPIGVYPAHHVPGIQCILHLRFRRHR
jgi:hypothetical protein